MRLLFQFVLYIQILFNSIRCQPTDTFICLTLYENEDFTGWEADFPIPFCESKDFSASEILSRGGIANTASAVKIYSNCVVTFYDSPNFQGWEVTLSEGEYTGSQLQLIGWVDDDVSSIRADHTDCGDCLDARDAAGCECSATADCVCNIDEFCCSDEWDDICVLQAMDACGCGDVAPPDELAGTLVGSYHVSSGPPRDDSPDSLTCLGACAINFGGTAEDYHCSTEPEEVNYMGWYDQFGIRAGCTTKSEAGPITNPVYAGGGAISAFVKDHFIVCANMENYCFISGAEDGEFTAPPAPDLVDCAAIYENDDFSGWVALLSVPYGDTAVFDRLTFEQAGGANNEASSAIVFAGCTVIMFESPIPDQESEVIGWSIELTEGTYSQHELSLIDPSWNNDMSSAVVTHTPGDYDLYCGDCSTTNFVSPGCENKVIEACVCGIDPFCCTNSFDIVCAEKSVNDCHCIEGDGQGSMSPTPETPEETDEPTTEQTEMPVGTEAESLETSSEIEGASFETEGETAAEILDAEYVYDASHILIWELEIDDLDELLADPAEETYVECTVKLQDEYFTGAGCRFQRVDDGKDAKCLLDDSGDPLDLPLSDLHSPNCRSLSFQVDSNEFREDSQKIFGFKKLQFHSMNEGKDLIRERLAYEMFNAAGIVVPRTVHTLLRINGNFEGLFLLVEELDDVFTKDRFWFDDETGEGSLYQDAWPNALQQSYYKEFEEEGGSKKDREMFVDFAEDCDEASSSLDEQEAMDIFSEYFSAHQVAQLTALYTLMNVRDEFHTVMCDPSRDGRCSTLIDEVGDAVDSLSGDSRFHPNFYFYVLEEGSKQFYILPRDLSYAFFHSRDCGGNLRDPACFLDDLENVEPWWLVTEECDVFTDLETRTTLHGVPFTCDVVGKVVTLASRDLSTGYIESYASELFTSAWYDDTIDSIADQIRPLVAASSLDVSVLEWENAVDSLKQSASFIRQQALDFTNNLPWDAADISTPTDPGSGSGDGDGEQNADILFDRSEIRDFYMTLPQTGLDFLLADPQLEEYAECEMEILGETYKGCGCRFKGSGSAFTSCLRADSGMGRRKLPLQSLRDVGCRSFSWKVDANNFRDDSQKFFGMKKLQFHSMSQNTDYIRERMAYNMLAEQGLIAPRAMHVRLHINGELEGLFLLVEQIDDVFTKRNFKFDDNNGDGTLYKELYWNALIPEFYDKTFEEEDGGGHLGQMCVDFLEMSITEQNRGLTDEDAETILEQWFDMDTFSTYAAMIDFLNNYDSFFYVTCSNPCGEVIDEDGNVVSTVTNDARYIHNYFIYVKKESGLNRYEFVPWDYDLSLQHPFTFFTPDPHWSVLPEQSGAICSEEVSVGRGSFKTYSCDPAGYLIARGIRRRWLEELERLTEYYNADDYEESVNEIRDQIKDTVLIDPLTDSKSQWEDEVDDVISDFPSILSRARGYVDDPPFLNT